MRLSRDRNWGHPRLLDFLERFAVDARTLDGCDKVFKEKRSGVDAGRPELRRCLEYLREGDTLLVTKIDRLARSTSDLYRIISQLAEKGVAFKVVDDPTIDTTSRTGKLVMGILALIAEFENDIRRERQMDGIAKAKERGTRFGRKPELTAEKVAQIRSLRADGTTVPEIIRRVGLSKATVYRQKGVVHKHKKSVVPCRDKIDELVCTDDPDCQWDAKKSKCKKTNEGNDRCSVYESEFYCEANKCNWHRMASKCSTKPSLPY